MQIIDMAAEAQIIELRELRGRKVAVEMKNGSRIVGIVESAKIARGGQEEINVKRNDGRFSGPLDSADMVKVIAL